MRPNFRPIGSELSEKIEQEKNKNKEITASKPYTQRRCYATLRGRRQQDLSFMQQVVKCMVPYKVYGRFKRANFIYLFLHNHYHNHSMTIRPISRRIWPPPPKKMVPPKIRRKINSAGRKSAEKNIRPPPNIFSADFRRRLKSRNTQCSK